MIGKSRLTDLFLAWIKASLSGFHHEFVEVIDPETGKLEQIISLPGISVVAADEEGLMVVKDNLVTLRPM